MAKLIAPVVHPGAMAGMEQPVIAVDDEISLRPFLPVDAPAVVQAFSTPDIQHYHFRRFDDPLDPEDPPPYDWRWSDWRGEPKTN